MSGLSRYHQSCAGSPTVWLKITSKLSLFFTYRVSVSLSFCRISCLSYHVITCPVQVNLNFGSKSCLVCRVFTYHVSVSLTFCPKSRPRYRGITRPVRYRKLSRYLEVSLDQCSVGLPGFWSKIMPELSRFHLSCISSPIFFV